MILKESDQILFAIRFFCFCRSIVQDVLLVADSSCILIFVFARRQRLGN